jgi:hypothetical protein
MNDFAAVGDFGIESSVKLYLSQRKSKSLTRRSFSKVEYFETLCLCGIGAGLSEIYWLLLIFCRKFALEFQIGSDRIIQLGWSNRCTLFSAPYYGGWGVGRY